MYVSVEDIRIEGLTDPPYSDGMVAERIALAQEAFERLTGQFFNARSDYTVKLDGRGHNTLWLPFPPVSVDALTSVAIISSGGTSETLDADQYVVDMPEFPDGRMNPKLLRVSGAWPKGTRNIEIIGEFGFVESDKSTPLLVKNAVKRIAIKWLPQLGDAEADKADRIIEESLGDYRYKLADLSKTGGFFGDPKIDYIIRMFRKTDMATV